MTVQETDPKTFSFEEAYARLEVILEKLNSGESPLEVSLNLYEEANRLIKQCSSKLDHAEQKIEMLIKSRDGKTEIAPFTPDQNRILKQPHDTTS
ncbi:MAG: exodeoxyribonuclease VII small subunit [Chlamydiia bacterium]|nr:exodeoxyribonuclease VII small subunit [Chlamydiia bacterium]